MFLTTTNGHEYQIDEIDVDLAKYGWHLDKSGYIRCHSMGYNYKKGIHTIIAKRMGLKKGFEPDHENGIKTDNRRKNLRIATRSQNAANSKKTF